MVGGLNHKHGNPCTKYISFGSWNAKDREVGQSCGSNVDLIFFGGIGF
jgi:hypothetical protein